MLKTMAFHDAEVELAHRSALRSIARVVEDTAVPTAPELALAGIAKQLRRGPAVVLTGAGVSTDSGIPDYRGPQGSLSRHRPMTYQEFRYDPVASHRYWARSFVGWRVMNQAQPNRTHHALVELERAGLINGVITQNVDGLHKLAGTHTLVALHGDMETVMCLECGNIEDRNEFDVRLNQLNPGYVESLLVSADMVNPDGDVTLDDSAVERFHMAGCTRCGSKLLKPDVVYFGESVPHKRKADAYSLLDAASSLLVAGSSLAVMSGMRFVLEARKQDKPVAIINGGPGRADTRADILWRTQVGTAFDALLDELDLS